MNENILLNTSIAQYLFHECAKSLPIIDFHNHLDVKDLVNGRQFENLARLWVLSDPYKHRAMRICGVGERYITGNASDREKYEAWMNTLPKLIGNPLYDWSILEIMRIFDIELNPEEMDVKTIWDEANAMLALPEFTAMELLNKFNVEYSAPCASISDDMTDFLSFGNVAPSLRGDDMVNVTHYAIEKLEAATQLEIHSLEDYYSAIAKQLEFFEKAGCKFSDHALDNGFKYYRPDGKDAARFLMVREGKILENEDQKRLTSEILRFLAGAYAKSGWTMQLHIGAERFTSSRLHSVAGPAGGFAGIGNCCDVSSLTQMLDDMEQGQGLPRTILFTLNPSDNAVMSVLIGSYSEDGVVGKIQQGPAWWWCDHIYGMREVFENLSSFGVLSTFVGMTTDSRSILSFVRHEYFRRVLCGWIGEKAEMGQMPNSKKLLTDMVEKVCYYNAKNRLG